MGPLLKLLVVALLTLPAGAFAVGRLAAEPVGTVPHRAPVVLEDPLPAEPAQTINGRPGRDDRPKRSRGPGPVEVIGPRPTELDEEPGDPDDDADEREPSGASRGPSPQDGPRDDAEDRDLDDREDDDPADADDPEDGDPEDGETDAPEDEKSDEEDDEEDDEADDD